MGNIKEERQPVQNIKEEDNEGSKVLPLEANIDTVTSFSEWVFDNVDLCPRLFKNEDCVMSICILVMRGEKLPKAFKRLNKCKKFFKAVKAMWESFDKDCTEYPALPIVQAFGEKQYKKVCKKLGLKELPKDKAKVESCLSTIDLGKRKKRLVVYYATMCC